jgi:hypothetical protein
VEHNQFAIGVEPAPPRRSDKSEAPARPRPASQLARGTPTEPRAGQIAGPSTEAEPQATEVREQFLDNRWVAAAFRDPCCGGLIVVLPLIGLYVLVRWTVSTGSFAGIAGLAVVAIVLGGVVGLVRRRAARRRAQPLSGRGHFCCDAPPRRTGE